MINPHNNMKNKPLSAYKKKKLIESFCDELTATQAAHRLNLDRNTVNKYFKRIRECIAGYREYQKMKLMITVMSSPDQQVQSISKNIPSANALDNGIPIKIMCIDGQLLTDVESGQPGNGSKFMMNISGYFKKTFNGHDHHLQLNGTDCSDLNRIADDFHSFTTTRFKKFFGIKSEYAYLYVKEAEFVFNEKEYAQRERVLNQMSDQIFV
jgi:transposase-like protein